MTINKQLLDALRPLAELSLPEDFYAPEPDDEHDDLSATDYFIRRGDIRQARRAIEAAEQPAPVPVKITADTPADYSNDTIREHAEMLVQREVLCHVASLVHDLAKSPTACAELALDYEEDALPLVQRVDYKSAARAAGYRVVACDAGYQWLGPDEELTEDSYGAFADETAAWIACCEYNDIEPQRHEVYEHWIVSDWLADELGDRGECVARDFAGMTIWGRCTTGQHISMDRVMLEIARDALAGE